MTRSSSTGRGGRWSGSSGSGTVASAPTTAPGSGRALIPTSPTEPPSADPPTRGAASPQRVWRDARAAVTSEERVVIGRLTIERMFYLVKRRRPTGGRLGDGTEAASEAVPGRPRATLSPRSRVPRSVAARCEPSWGCSSAGRAPRSHRGGQGFESPHLHHLALLCAQYIPAVWAGMYFQVGRPDQRVTALTSTLASRAAIRSLPSWDGWAPSTVRSPAGRVPCGPSNAW